MYIKREIEEVINNKINNNELKVLFLVGPRQVGKTSILKRLPSFDSRNYITLDDLSIRNIALTNPALFLKYFNPPVLIDEIQYAPQLLNYIKMYIDNNAGNNDIWIASSQKNPLKNLATDIFGNQIAIYDIQGLSWAEIKNINFKDPFLPTQLELFTRLEYAKKQNLEDIFTYIWQGNMPLMNDLTNSVKWRSFYASYVQTFINLDIIKILQINDEMAFFRFLTAAATQTGKLINYAELAKAAGISAPTAKQWVKTLEATGIVYLLEPFMPPGAKYIVKTPKLYFFDTGLAAYLLQFENPKSLELSDMSTQFFETLIITEIYKSYNNKGINPPLYYLRNFNGKEIELIIYNNYTIYPIKINKCINPKKDIKNFAILEPVSIDTNIKIDQGGIICLSNELTPVSDNLCYIPVWLL